MTKEQLAICRNIDEPEILKSELAKLNRNKAAGPDGIVIEMLEALNDFGIDTITAILN